MRVFRCPVVCAVLLLLALGCGTEGDVEIRPVPDPDGLEEMDRRVREQYRELRDRLRADRPELKYIFISGYTDEIIAQHDMDREGAHLLQKPFGPREFLLKIRQILEASA